MRWSHPFSVVLSGEIFFFCIIMSYVYHILSSDFYIWNIDVVDFLFRMSIIQGTLQHSTWSSRLTSTGPTLQIMGSMRCCYSSIAGPITLQKRNMNMPLNAASRHQDRHYRARYTHIVCLWHLPFSCLVLDIDDDHRGRTASAHLVSSAIWPEATVAAVILGLKKGRVTLHTSGGPSDCRHCHGLRQMNHKEIIRYSYLLTSISLLFFLWNIQPVCI